MKTSTLTFLLFFLIFMKISGQNKVMDDDFKWDINLSSGKPAGFTGKDLRENVNTLYPDSYNITTRHPGLNWSLEISHTLNDRLSIGLSLNMNTAFQVSSSNNYFSYNTTRDYTVKIGEISSVFYYNFNKFLSCGIGPALFKIKPKNVEYNESGNLTWKNTKNLNGLLKPGFEVITAFKYPLVKRLSAVLDINYRYMGKARKMEMDSGTITVNMTPVDIINYGYNIRLSHLFIDIGLELKI